MPTRTIDGRSARAAGFAALAAVASLAWSPWAQADGHENDTPNLVHDRHQHQNNPKHVTVAPDGTRFFTNRQSEVVLPLPAEDEAFTFAVFGDRTGGPDEGVNVLADAVRDVNLFEPDLVMTVGDLIQGYNQTDEWLVEMREFKAVMDELISPWFPVAGNHDIYWRGPDRPEGEHEASYEIHFGPLWYSFFHKNSQFIVLFSDEGNPETGEKSIRDAAAQVMSPEQKAWLREALERGKSKTHQFVFLHHPRWLPDRYGRDWKDNVHQMLVEAGNVRAVFAGHIHQLRYDPRDGIEYMTLATVGGHQRGTVPQAGWLHHYNIVTVREDQIALAAVPVGEVLDVREITGELHDQAGELATQEPGFDTALALGADGSVYQTVTMTVENPTGREVELTVSPAGGDSRWVFTPDHAHATLGAGGSKSVTFQVFRPAGTLDEYLREPQVAIDLDMLAPGFRYEIPTIRAGVPLDLSEIDVPSGLSSAGRVLSLDGAEDAVRVPSEAVSFAGPKTIEAWFNARSFRRGTALLGNTERSGFGVFVGEAEPYFTVHAGGRYNEPRPEVELETDRWYHIAGVDTGSEVRLYLDGKLIASGPAAGDRTLNALPLFIGAETDRGGRPTRFFDGLIDEVRLSEGVRYEADFEPRRHLAADEQTVFHYSFDRAIGPYVLDGTARANHAKMVGAPTLLSE